MKHVTQPTHDTCIIACLSMLSGHPVEDLEILHRCFWEEGQPVHVGLTKLGVEWKALPRLQNTLEAGKVYLATVPSLNLPGTFHQILLDCREPEILILDPAAMTGKLYYSLDVIDGMSVPLTSWILDYEVVPLEQPQGASGHATR